MKKIRIAVIYGGASGEHEVSLLSAKSVMAALDAKKYDVLPIKIGKDGKWSKELSAKKIDVVFPIVHGTGGEDGALQGHLELSGIPYVGSGVLGSAIGMDKIIQKKIFEREGFPISAYEHFTVDEWKHKQQDIVAAIEKYLTYPCFVKPANLGSSVGISKAHHRKELIRGIELALTYDRRVVVEAAVHEAREIECAVLGNDEPRPSVLGEIVPSNEFYDYAAKYVDGKSQTIIGAALPKHVTARIRTMACKAFLALDAAGLARVDFFVQRDSNDVYLNEINTLPGFTSISMYPKLWEATGLDYSDLLDELVGLALDRAKEKRALSRDFPAAVGKKAAAKKKKR